jgi:hypothetical protein
MQAQRLGWNLVARAEDRRLQDNGEDGVSVIVPMYNAAATIERTLASVCEQTYKNLEIIVVDDGSRDASAEIVRKWEKADSRVRLYSQANAGVAAARNAGFAQSSKCLVAFIDADDLWAPDKIRAQVEVLRENSGPALVYCWFAEINDLDQVTSAVPRGHVGNVGAQIARWNFVGNASSMLMPRSVFEKAGGFNVEPRAAGAQGCEDLLFLMRVAEHVPFRSVPRYLVGYRVTKGTMSSDTRQMRRSFEVALAKNQQRSPQFATEHAAHMASALGWLAARATASGDHGAAASHLVRLGKVAPINAARGIYRFYRFCMTGAGRKPLSTKRYQDMVW